MEKNKQSRARRIWAGAKMTLKLMGLTLGLVFLGLFLDVVVHKFMPVTDTYYMRAMAKKNGVDVHQTWVPLKDISPNLSRAVIASEDNFFAQHHGFSVGGIKAAFANNQKEGKRIHGGSTISQQTAKNVFLWNGSTIVSKAVRKGFEAVLTVMIEAVWGKQRIMEVYLNVVEYGPGIYGAEATAQKYFHHSAKKITASEAALMAAVMPSPIKYKIAKPGPYVLKRQGKILWLMPKMRRFEH